METNENKSKVICIFTPGDYVVNKKKMDTLLETFRLFTEIQPNEDWLDAYGKLKEIIGESCSLKDVEIAYSV